ncbi:Uncharacterised protein [uncultured archaeon]|nr:Uncharacterised protein [uncultured archaeon]
MVENTYKTKLVEYAKKNLKKGYPVDTLRIALINQGYSRPTVDESIKEAIKLLASEAPVIKEKPQIEHEVVAEDEVPVVEVKKSFWKKLFGKK